MKKKLVAIITNDADDIYCFRKELIEAIYGNGFDILISCPYGNKFDIMDLSKYIYDNPSIDRRGTNPLTDIKLFFHYFSLLKKFRPDVVLTYTAKPNIYANIAAHLLKIPVIANVTGFGSLLFEKGIKKNLIMSLYKFSLRKAHTLMFQNEANCKLASEYNMINGLYKILPGSGVNLDRFTPKDYPDGGDGIIGNNVVFNYIGRVVRDKGIDDYLEAARRIKQTHPNIVFNILGSIEPTADYYNDILKDLQSKNIVNYLGSQNDVRPFIEKSHATILPSYGEGMSNSLLETAASARPIITTDVQGCKETVIKNVSGYVYRCRDVESLCAYIEKFLSLNNADRKNMGIAGRKHVEHNFSRQIVINKYIETINQILGEN